MTDGCHILGRENRHCPLTAPPPPHTHTPTPTPTGTSGALRPTESVVWQLVSKHSCRAHSTQALMLGALASGIVITCSVGRSIQSTENGRCGELEHGHTAGEGNQPTIPGLATCHSAASAASYRQCDSSAVVAVGSFRVAAALLHRARWVIVLSNHDKRWGCRASPLYSARSSSCGQGGRSMPEFPM
jgi:hypothetical protein